MGNEMPSAIPENLTLTHDGYFRETFQVLRIARAILRKALPAETTACIDLEGLTVEERSLGDDMFKDTAADVIYKVPIKKTAGHVNFFTVIEHKSFQDLLTIFQLWGYVFRICLRELRLAEKRGEVDANYRLPPVVAIIIHHGDTKFQGVTELADLFFPLPGLEQYLPRLRVILFDLNAIADDDPLLNDPEVPELNVVLMVLKTIFRHDGAVALTLSDVLRVLKPYSDDSETRRIIRATWYYLAGNARYLREDPAALSGIFRDVIIGDNDMRTLVEVWKEEGIAIGEARGEARGKAETLLRVLRARFKRVPREVEQTIRHMTDPIALDSWAEHAATCQSMDEFTTALNG